jgi:hypothetical protein
MVKLITIKSSLRINETNYIVADIYADSENDNIGIDNNTIEGLTSYDRLTAGSTCITSTGNVAILNSSNVWNWI